CRQWQSRARLARRQPDAVTGAARPDDAGDGWLRLPRQGAGGRPLCRSAHRRPDRQGIDRERAQLSCRAHATGPHQECATDRPAWPCARCHRGPPPRDAPQGRLMTKILLVEDNEMNRDMLSRRLGRKGYDIAMAVDGQQGVEMATAERPDLILMD